MADNAEYIAPVDHSTLSATATVGGTTADAAVKGGIRWGAKSIALGAAIGLGWAVLSMVALPAVVVTLAHGLLWGGLIGVIASPAAAGLGSAVKGFKGFGDGVKQVKMENAQAKVMDMQLQAAKYNALAQANSGQSATTVYAPSANNYNGLSGQDAAMNTASPQIGSIQYDGTVNNQQRLATLG